MSEKKPKKQQRISRACDFCHRRSIKCRPCRTKSNTCANCLDFDILCTYERPAKRGRGLRPVSQNPSPQREGSHIPPSNTANHQTRNSSNDSVQEKSYLYGATPVTSGSPDESWKAFGRISHSIVISLLEIYFQVVYPIFPFFNKNDVHRRVERGQHLEDRNFFASVMAACALAAGRYEDGGALDQSGNLADYSMPSTGTFFIAAEQNLPPSLTDVNCLDALRVYPILAITGIQRGRIDVMHKYVGLYFSILSIKKWHDEVNWPQTLSVSDREQMRRLYWSTYTLDVYSAIVWNGCVHFQEAHSKVQYPSDAELHDRSQGDEPSPNDEPSWMIGWNFTTDLYRVLEHAVSRCRTQSSKFNILEMAAPSSPTFSSSVNSRVNELYSNLPDIFKKIEPMSGNPTEDIYGFQAANIQATLALLRMMLFTVEAHQDIDKKCSVASELLTIFHQIPGSYLRAISAPLIYHLAGIGNILGSVINAPLSETLYARVRELLISMATLLESLDSILHKRTGAKKSLLDQVERIDQYMASQLQNQQLEHEALLQRDLHSTNWDAGPTNEISPQYQLPDDLLLDWPWPVSIADDTFYSFNNQDFGT